MQRIVRTLVLNKKLSSGKGKYSGVFFFFLNMSPHIIRFTFKHENKIKLHIFLKLKKN